MTRVDDVLDRLVQVVPEIRSSLIEHRHKTTATNPSGDVQLAADQHVDDLLREALADLDAVGQYVSEERDDAVDVGEGLSVAIDPLDGSSNLLANSTVGTIVGLYDAPLPASGRDLVAAAYVLYGPITTMTVGTDDGTVRHTLRDGSIVDTETVTLPDEPTVCGFSGPTAGWDPAVRDYADGVQETLSVRYTGAMVADVEQVLTHGGIVGYPATHDRSAGVLRLQFESNPVAYIVEAAGGRSSTGTGSILDLEPTTLHQRTPTYFGNAGLVEDLETALASETRET